MNWRKSVFLKKSTRYGFASLKYLYGFFLSVRDYSQSPPVLCNSFPKSGTHLLVQIIQALPEIRDWGSFLASTPSITFREISQEKMCKRIQRIVPRELVSGHLFFSKKMDNSLASKKTVHYFIYRDLRDVVISEAFYLHKMNRWHRLHKYFKALSSDDERIMFSINGSCDPKFPYDYPDVKKRFERYRGWLNNPKVFAVRYEDLISQNKAEIIDQMVAYYQENAQRKFEKDEIVQKALANIRPEKSHTFREGKSGKWKEVFKSEHKKRFKEVAGDLLIELGYEKDYSW